MGESFNSGHYVTPDTNCKSIFLIEKPDIKGFLKIIGAQNELPIT